MSNRTATTQSIFMSNLKQLAELLSSRNSIDREIAGITDSPAITGYPTPT